MSSYICLPSKTTETPVKNCRVYMASTGFSRGTYVVVEKPVDELRPVDEYVVVEKPVDEYVCAVPAAAVMVHCNV